MEPSLFIDYVESRFPKLVLAIVKEINGQRDGEEAPSYYYQRFLSREWSMTGKWDSLQEYNQRLMADVIAMDSSLPLKKRPTIAAASGEIPKLGMEMALNETQLTELQLLTRLNAPPVSQIVAKLFRDTATVIRGQYERIEAMFLEGLSRGVVEVTTSNNVGSEVRINYNYPAQNQLNATLPWSNPAATPVQDLIRLVKQARANGHPIRTFLLRQEEMETLLNSDDALQLYAQVNNLVNGATFAPTQDAFESAFRKKYGATFMIIDRVCRYQINGVDTDYEPWEAGQIIGINNDNLGKLVWATLAEMNAPVAGVTYQVADEFVLASKYRVNRPSLAEFTNSQSRVLPVIAATQQIHKLDTTQGTTT